MISRLILVQPDERAGAALSFAFEREGIRVDRFASVDRIPSEALPPAGLVVVGGQPAEAASACLAEVRGAAERARVSLPVLYVGNGISRSQALADGASEFVGQPAFVRDIVTVARLVAGRKPEQPAILAGELAEHFGMFYLVRAVVLLKRRGVLTIVRGLRRGELRFFDGEVTSAQVGDLHGLAALHQLLLWTEGRFELRPENVVRRRQIPLEPAELIADAERFLTETAAIASRLSPVTIYERDAARAEAFGKKLPDPVALVWRLFDGNRTLADVVEDSPYRMFETLQVGNRLAELGLLRENAGRSRSVRRVEPASPVEAWLNGGALARATEGDRDADWVLPQAAEDLHSPPSVVPATEAAGEITVGRREVAAVAAPARERIEEVAGGAQLSDLFSDPTQLDGARTIPFERVAPDDGVPRPIGASPAAEEDIAHTRPLARIDPTEASIEAAGEIAARARTSSSSPPPVVEPAVVVSEPSDPVADAARSFVKVALEPAAPVPPERARSTTGRHKRHTSKQNKQTGKHGKHKSGKHRKGRPSSAPPVAATSAAVAAKPAAVVAAKPAAAPAPVARAAAPAAVASPVAAASTPSVRPELDQLIRNAEHTFSAEEEAFFAAGQDLSDGGGRSESFDDLDEAYEIPRSFWQRFFRRPDAPLRSKKPPR